MSDVRRDQGNGPASGGMLPTVMLPLAESFDDDPALSIRFVGEEPIGGSDAAGSDVPAFGAVSDVADDASGAPNAADDSADDPTDGSADDSADAIPTMPVDPADIVTAERSAVASRPSVPSEARAEETVSLEPLSASESAAVPPPPSFFPSNTTGRMRPISVPSPRQSRMVSGSSSFRPAQPVQSGAERAAKPRSGLVAASSAQAVGVVGKSPRICYSSQYRVLHPAG